MQTEPLTVDNIPWTIMSSIECLNVHFTLRIIRNRVSGWQNADVQGLCTLFQGWQGWQEGVRCWRTQHKNGWKQVLLLPPRPMAITARDEDAAFTAFEFSREFGALEPIKQTFATDKTLNSLENSVLYLNLAFTPSHSLSGFGHLSPLSPSKKGAYALYIGVLSPWHP